MTVSKRAEELADFFKGKKIPPELTLSCWFMTVFRRAEEIEDCVCVCVCASLVSFEGILRKLRGHPSNLISPTKERAPERHRECVNMSEGDKEDDEDINV